MAGGDISAENAPYPSLIVLEGRIPHRGRSELDGPEHADEQVAPHAAVDRGERAAGALRAHLRDLS